MTATETAGPYAHLRRWTRADNYAGADLSDRYTVIGRTRDANLLEASNYDVACAQLQALDPDGRYVEIHHFRHWACGWIDALTVRVDAPAALLAAADTLLAQLADYPILDESDYCDRESAEMARIWGGMDRRDRIAAYLEHQRRMGYGQRDARESLADRLDTCIGTADTDFDFGSCRLADMDIAQDVAAYLQACEGSEYPPCDYDGVYEYIRALASE